MDCRNSRCVWDKGGRMTGLTLITLALLTLAVQSWRLRKEIVKP
jgi:hypothetical protein